MDNQNLEGIKEVKVRVVDVKEKNIKINGSVNTYYTVTVDGSLYHYTLCWRNSIRAPKKGLMKR